MKTALKLIACWVAFGLSIFAEGFLVSSLNLRMNPLPTNVTIDRQLFMMFVAGAVLVLGLFPLARGLAGSRALIAAALGVFLSLALAVNTILEVLNFSNAFDGAVPGYAVGYALQILFVAAAMGASFAQVGTPAGFPARGWPAWTGRGLIAWIAWPFIYFLFGMCAAPIVLPYYRSGGFPGLHIPPVGHIFALQLLRSAIFMASSLPLIALWKGSRRGLWIALGLAHWVVVGLYGMVSAAAFPLVLRITHSIEIGFDSFAYAGLLVLLFAAPGISAESAAIELGKADPSPHPSM
jgi:hypothetical protein